MSEARLRELIEVGRSLVSDLSPDSVLDQVLERARELTGARYAALGILDERHERLERFLTLGIDESEQREIGDLPRGRGILGLLIDDPRPLRLDRVSTHPRSYGFPLNHPPMTTFLGVPVTIRGQAWGNLYLTDKNGSEPFTAADEEAAVVLADWAALAIDNARQHQRGEARRHELERAVRSLEATTAIAHAVGGETRLDRVLELIVKRGRALIGARALVLLLTEGEELVVNAQAGELDVDVSGARAQVAGSVFGEVLSSLRPARVDDVGARIGAAGNTLGIEARCALLVPLVYRGGGVGVLVAFDRLGEHPAFQVEDEALLRSFAASAATAVATAKLVEADALRRGVAAAERERARWARELHDDLLQELGALRLELSSSLRGDDADRLRATVTDSVGRLDASIRELRRLIAELRPAALDDFGLPAALESLVDHAGAEGGLEIEARIALGAGRYGSEVETAIYRLIQESLTNVVKHARARHVKVEVVEVEGRMEVVVSDDGRGFDPIERAEGFGLLGMRERVNLLGGELTVSSSPAGTAVCAHLTVASEAGQPSRPASAARTSPLSSA